MDLIYRVSYNTMSFDFENFFKAAEFANTAIMYGSSEHYVGECPEGTWERRPLKKVTITLIRKESESPTVA